MVYPVFLLLLKKGNFMNGIHRKRYVVAKLFHMAVSIAIFYICWLLFRYKALSFRGDIAYRYNYYVCAGYAVILFFFKLLYVFSIKSTGINPPNLFE